jgi:hypothetical protein
MDFAGCGLLRPDGRSGRYRSGGSPCALFFERQATPVACHKLGTTIRTSSQTTPRSPASSATLVLFAANLSNVGLVRWLPRALMCRCFRSRVVNVVRTATYRGHHWPGSPLWTRRHLMVRYPHHQLQIPVLGRHEFWVTSLWMNPILKFSAYDNIGVILSYSSLQNITK